MSNKRDYYEILGISREASAEDIKRSYRRLARQYHPDVNSNDKQAEEKFKEINEAYEALSDPQKRRMYDQFGHQGVNGRYADAGAGFDGFSDLGGFGDIFDMFFGGGARTGGRRQTVGEPGSDLRYDLEISLEEAASDLEKDLRISRMGNCSTCEGSGAQPGTSRTTCPNCRGAGQVRHSRQTILGSFDSITTCPVCRGDGSVISDPCKTCDGQGRMRESTDVHVRIPAGVEHGSRVRLRGQGDAGARGGHAGDLYVFVHIPPHEVFERRGDDIICEMPISFVQAALGDTIEVPTLDGSETVHIPEGTQTGETFRIPGKGMPNINSGSRGSEYVVVRIQVPRKLNDEQKRLLLEFGKTTGVELNPDGKNFFEKLLGR